METMWAYHGLSIICITPIIYGTFIYNSNYDNPYKYYTYCYPVKHELLSSLIPMGTTGDYQLISGTFIYW